MSSHILFLAIAGMVLFAAMALSCAFLLLRAFASRNEKSGLVGDVLASIGGLVDRCHIFDAAGRKWHVARLPKAQSYGKGSSVPSEEAQSIPGERQKHLGKQERSGGLDLIGI